MRKVEATTLAVTEYLTNGGVASGAIELGSVSAYPQEEYSNGNSTGRILNYRASRSITVRSDDVEGSWLEPQLRYLGFAIDARDAQGLFVAINGGASDLDFKLPGASWGNSYRSIFDSCQGLSDFAPVLRKPDDTFSIKALTLQIWLINRS